MIVLTPTSRSMAYLTGLGLLPPGVRTAALSPGAQANLTTLSPSVYSLPGESGSGYKAPTGPGPTTPAAPTTNWLLWGGVAVGAILLIKFLKD